MPDGESDQALGESRTAGGAYSRPSFRALLDAQPVPAVVYGHGGVPVYPNRAAARLLTMAPTGSQRILAQDGTDLWTIIEARADEADPFFDVRVRLRVRDGHASDCAMSVVPVRGPGGPLGGAVIFVLSIASDRQRGVELEAPLLSVDSIPAFVEAMGRQLDADCLYMLEVDAEVASEARVVASWTSDGSALPSSPFSLRGTPSDSFGGRRLVCVPSGVAEEYPDDTTFAAGGYDAYVGAALTDESGRMIGVLAGLWRAPLKDVTGTSAVFAIASKQAAHALTELLSRRELRESEQRYGSVFEGSAVPILLIEPDTTQIVDANPAACALYGYSRDELTSMSVLQLDALPPETVQGELKRALDGSRSHFIGKHILCGGTVLDVEVNIGPIMVGGRQLLYAMVNDITERMRMEAELERSRRALEGLVAQRTQDLLRANTELQQASTARDMVFASLTQELRTSLQTILGFSDLLLSGRAGDLAEEQLAQVQMIREASASLTSLASTLAEAREIDEAPVSHDEFDLVGLVESVAFGLTAFAEDKRLTLRISAPERPVAVETDRYKLQQIVLNLLSNAIRYTEKGGVTVTVAPDTADWCLVTVSDTGPGLPPERARRIFDGPEVHQFAAGIGLPTSRRIAETLGGTISVESTPGRGSAFTLRIPRVPLGEASAE